MYVIYCKSAKSVMSRSMGVASCDDTPAFPSITGTPAISAAKSGLSSIRWRHRAARSVSGSGDG